MATRREYLTDEQWFSATTEKALVAELTGTSEKEEPRPFETILKKSGLVNPVGQFSNRFYEHLKMLSDLKYMLIK